MKPHVICHIMVSLDGRIITKRWGVNTSTKAYEIPAARFDAQAWLCGRVTMEQDFTDGLPPDHQNFVADAAATSFAIAIDAPGWISSGGCFPSRPPCSKATATSTARCLRPGWLVS